jgi:putative ABC transport system substrate-binding protein
VSDPVEQGFVPSLARPGGNITGFALPEFSIASKWADLLKQLKPSIARVAFVFHPESSPQSRLFVNAAQTASAALAVEVLGAPVRSTADLEETFSRLSREPAAGLIFPANAFTRLHAKSIVAAAARWRLPAIYADDIFVAEGGLMFYQADLSEPFRLVPFYVDRILKGTPPGDLPVQLPQKFRFVVNRGMASALGIDVPLGVLLAADEVIE